MNFRSWKMKDKISEMKYIPGIPVHGIKERFDKAE
jgi:hypothetical protein